MGLNSRPCDAADEKRCSILHYQLDFQRNGDKHYYIWRGSPPDESEAPPNAILLDLGDVYVPGPEIEKMLGYVFALADGVAFVALVHCHARNQQDIKRRLKARDVKLYSNTAFFSDAERAGQWLASQCTNC